MCCFRLVVRLHLFSMGFEKQVTNETFQTGWYPYTKSKASVVLLLGSLKIDACFKQRALFVKKEEPWSTVASVGHVSIDLWNVFWKKKDPKQNSPKSLSTFFNKDLVANIRAHWRLLGHCAYYWTDFWGMGLVIGGSGRDDSPAKSTLDLDKMFVDSRCLNYQLCFGLYEWHTDA